jgi:hypothetical protein
MIKNPKDAVSMTPTHIAIASPNEPAKIIVYAKIESRDATRMRFTAINGRWSGTLKNADVLIDGKIVGQGIVVWEGQAVPSHYNDAIKAIEAHLADRNQAVPVFMRGDDKVKDAIAF